MDRDRGNFYPQVGSTLRMSRSEPGGSAGTRHKRAGSLAPPFGNPIHGIRRGSCQSTLTVSDHAGVGSALLIPLKNPADGGNAVPPVIDIGLF